MKGQGARSRRWLLGTALGVVIAGVAGAWLVPGVVDGARRRQRDRVVERLRSLEAELQPEAPGDGEMGACLLALLPTTPGPLDSAVRELGRRQPPEWECEAARAREWPLYAPSVPLERCDGSTSVAWNERAHELLGVAHDATRRFEIALREPDPDQRLAALIPVLRSMHALQVIGTATVHAGAAVRAAEWTGAADPSARRELAQTLRRWAEQTPDHRATLAAQVASEPAYWAEVRGWADFPWSSPWRAAADGPLGFLGPHPEPAESDVAALYDDPYRAATPERRARELLVAAMLLEGTERETRFMEQTLTAVRREGRLCVETGDTVGEAPCVRPELRNAVAIELDRAVQREAADAAGDEPLLPFAELPARPVAVPIRVDTARLPEPPRRNDLPEWFTSGQRVHFRLRWQESGAPQECAVVVATARDGSHPTSSAGDPRPTWPDPDPPPPPAEEH